MQKQPLLKALIKVGVGSRRQLSTAIKEGRVSVNGDVVTDFNHPVGSEKDSILLDGKSVDIKPQQLIYLMLNKPKGVLSTVRDERGRPTVMDLLPVRYHRLRLYPVGRLDKESSGLILLTNDGDLAYRLTHPRFEHEKEYLVKVKGVLKAAEIRRLENGTKLEDGKTSPAVVRKMESSDYNYSITIHEGKKRQVRRMFEVLGHPVIELKRIRIGKLKLGNLKEEKVREVGRGEIQVKTPL